MYTFCKWEGGKNLECVWLADDVETSCVSILQTRRRRIIQKEGIFAGINRVLCQSRNKSQHVEIVEHRTETESFTVR